MLAAIFSSYGNGTGQDRFIPVSKALLKKVAQRYACRHAGRHCVDRRCRIDQLSLYISSQLCRVCFLRGIACSQLLSVIFKVLKDFIDQKRDEKDVQESDPIFRCTTPSTGQRLGEVVVGTLYKLQS